MHPRRVERRSQFGVILLLYHVLTQVGIHSIPIITLAMVGLNVSVYLRLIPLPWRNPMDVCISVNHVWKNQEWSRLIYGAFEHGSDMHLYYNMVSFIVKGQSLEPFFGSGKFLYILSVFTPLTSAILVLISEVASQLLDRQFGFDCAVGFSGVIFALKVLTTYYWPRQAHFLGLPIGVPAKYAVWAELVIIQLFSPNVSFLGHLAGILVGLAYVYGPLKPIMDLFGDMFTEVDQNHNIYYNQQNPRNVRRDHATSNYTRFVPPGMSEEQQYQEAMEASLRDNSNTRGYGFAAPQPPPPPPGWSVPNADDIRSRRVNYFQ